MVDQTRKKLHIPNWFLPYLENYRINELFHEMARELVIQQPDDHVLFLKEILYNAATSTYAPRIILIAPPHINTLEVARGIANACNVHVITDLNILTATQCVSAYRPKARKLTNALHEILRSENIYYTGWILPDYPKTQKEAIYMQQEGILPTHVFQLIPSFAPDLFQFNYSKKGSVWLKYRRKILGIREAFKNTLKEILIENRNLRDVIDLCASLASVNNRHKSTIIPKICILGPRGSGKKTQAKQICKILNLVHVDFEYLLCQAWISETYLGSELRNCGDKVGENSLLLTSVIHKRILEYDCIERGWVLTGFPNTVEDFKYLDMIDTPINKIIFLECDIKVCRDRILNRRINCYSGSVVHILKSSARKKDRNIKVHPKDIDELFSAEIRYYCENYDAMRKYCGISSNVVNGNQVMQRVTENIEAIIMQPLPNRDPRAPCDENKYEKDDDNDSSYTSHITSCTCDSRTEIICSPNNSVSFKK